MTKLSVNINKIATLRNARGGNMPNIVKAAVDIQNFGAEGITVHPRPDQRHITYQDVHDLKKVVYTEFNIEGYPSPDFIALVLANKPTQVTLVPDSPDVITSNAGWDTSKHEILLKECIQTFTKAGIRTSLFMENDLDHIEIARKIGASRIELYTEAYANDFSSTPEKAIEPYINAAIFARNIGLEINAGHDLNLQNLQFFKEKIPFLKEVSIGHALISDALYYGLNNAVQMYKERLKSH